MTSVDSSMETRQRVVQSGKVYRQIFDAEVQLVQALEAKGSKCDGTKGPSVATKREKTTIPVVQTVQDGGAQGMLSERQVTWLEGFPNEGHIENPILNKFYTEKRQNVEREPESSHASKEVQSLPDVISPTKKGSDIIERIAESRRLRHEASLEDMHQALGLVSADLEPKIQAAGEELMCRLKENDQTLNEIMERISQDQSLIVFTIGSLHELWTDVASQSDLRQAWIRDLDTTLADIEDDRMDKIREIFRENAKILEKIAHLMLPELYRMLDKESQNINHTMLSNRRSYTDLYARLLIADIEREKRLHIHWTKRVTDWKQLHTDASVNNFILYMESDSVLKPPNVTDVLEQMNMEQEAINAGRIDLVNSLRDMKPPSSTKTSIYHWNEKLTNISVSIDELNQQYFNRVYAEYELVCQTCLEKVDELKTDLMDRGVCTEDEATKVINERCLPLVGQRQTHFERGLEKMDKELEQHNLDTLERLKSLFKFCQGAAHVWDVHELGLARQERALQEKLDQCRHLHDNRNQDREANLDIQMDRMRQDSSETSLQTSLKKVLTMMEDIKTAYHKFHTDQKTIVEQYPDMVHTELDKFDKAVCKFFGVNRKNPEELEQESSEAASVRSTDSPKPRSARGQKRAKSRSSSRTETPQQDNPLPVVISEVLNTAKGTPFYVLTVAGEHGIPPEDGPVSPPPDGSSSPSGSGSGSAFLTEVAPPDGSVLPPYIAAVDVGDDLLLDIKKTIRMNFLDFLEDWAEQSKDRSNSVVAAKVDELNSELDLRLHLHGPRSRRAELDVHNVRAAELVMHEERVSRHCKGINQALADLKHRFGQMTAEHNQLAAKLRADIEALEVVFINATKSSKLVALSNQLQVEQEAYMDKIRASLRSFRQHLDDTLQMLRESNARFIKSFRLFSDGGNFCPEEIDDFRKRLEKMSQKVDSAEGFIMADLEGMESKRLEQAAKVSREFEDRFKHHMVDLLFMEKIARWLTNTQVKVKAEVAESNSQAQRLAVYIDDLRRKIDACERPNLDKESVSPTQLNDFLQSILNVYHDRSEYLACLNDPIGRPSSVTLQGNPALGARVAFTTDTVPPVSRAGKQPSEDPTVGVIKNILKTQRNRLEFGADAGLDGELPPAQYQAQNSHPNLIPPSSREAPERSIKSRQSRHSDVETRSKRSSKPGTASNSTATADRPQRAVSGKPGKIDKKFYVFGEFHEEGEETHFVGKIRRILRESLDGLLQATELYYRQKGNRAVTRPQALQDNFEDCANVVIQKLQSYHRQAETYHNQCLQELRSQLSQLEDLTAHVPACIITETLNNAISTAKDDLQQADNVFSRQLQVWDQDKYDHEQELRPALGHPQRSAALQALCEAESARRTQYLQGVEQHAKEQQERAVTLGQTFVQQLAVLSEKLFLQFDLLLTIDDVKKGIVPPTKLPTAELLRRKNAGLPLEEEEEASKVTRGKNTWQGLPKTELIVPGSPGSTLEEAPSNLSVGSAHSGTTTSKKKSKQTVKREVSNTTAVITTAKTTLGHTATLDARDKAYQDYKAHFQRELSNIEDKKADQIVAEDRWTDSWEISVLKVKQLY